MSVKPSRLKESKDLEDALIRDGVLDALAVTSWLPVPFGSKLDRDAHVDATGYYHDQAVMFSLRGRTNCQYRDVTVTYSHKDGGEGEYSSSMADLGVYAWAERKGRSEPVRAVQAVLYDWRLLRLIPEGVREYQENGQVFMWWTLGSLKAHGVILQEWISPAVDKRTGMR